MIRELLGLIAAGIMSVFAALLISGQYATEGAVVLLLSAERGWGVHRGDILIVGGWLIGIIAVATLVLDRPGRPSRH